MPNSLPLIFGFMVLLFGSPAIAQRALAGGFVSIDNNAISNAESYKIDGIKNFNEKQWDAAISDFLKYYSINPTNPIVCDSLAAANFAKGDLNAAVHYYTCEILISSNNAKAYFNRGNSYRALARFSEAITDFNDSLRLDPSNSLVFSSRASAYFHRHEFENEISDLTRCLQLNPNDAIVLVRRADAYLQVKKYAQANQDFLDAIRIDPTNMNACNDYAWFLATCPEPVFRSGQEAIKAASKACVLADWKKWEFIDTLAAAQAEAGNFSAAINFENKAISMLPGDDQSKYLAFQHLLLYESHKSLNGEQEMNSHF